MKVKFAVLGDTFVDVVAGTLSPEQLPKWGGDVECSQPIQLQPGGSALNTATHLANLATRNPQHELHVALHTVVGTFHCWVSSAGFYSCANLRAKLKPLLEKARAKGVTTSLDTNYDSSEQWTGLEELFPLLDVFLPNEVEAMKVSRTQSLEAAMAYFTQRIPGITVIKVGAGGAIAHCSKTQQQWQQGSFRTDVVDVTGAGDSFNSGFLSAWKTNGGDVGDALRWGCGTASKTVAALGACSFSLAYDDVQTLITTGTVIESTD
ncbi:hypothetical protein BBJ28_00008892 [Nothophytophthora sp. Chile5]|nr:hypothetical protein BBJ28_00008892 [Nothophytophthora sp. Chile5]